MATDQPAGATAWITVSPDTDPLVDAHLAHAGGTVVGETWSGDGWREALAWARARTDQVYIRFDFTETTWWAGAGPPPQGGDRPVQPLPDRPTVFVDDWIAELLALRRRLGRAGGGGQWDHPRLDDGLAAPVRGGQPGSGRCRRAAPDRRVLGGGDRRYGRAGRRARPPGRLGAGRPARRHPELLVSSEEPPGRVTLTVDVADLDARVRWLRDLGGTVLHQTAGAALVEDPEGNRALLLQGRPDPHPARSR